MFCSGLGVFSVLGQRKTRISEIFDDQIGLIRFV